MLVDCANGIGAPALRTLAEKHLKSLINVTLVNTDTDNAEVLNADCGADYVKMKQCAPKGMQLAANQAACSLDGDADRIVFYFVDAGTPAATDWLASVFRLLDGDKIATAGFIMTLCKTSGVTVDGQELSVGLVQTAYANGSSTAYVKNTLVPLHH